MLMKKLLASVTLACAAIAGFAQTPYPSQPIHWIVPYAAGGSVDTLARTLADVMQPALGQTLVIDNRPGGSTNVAVAALLQSRPDGYTVMHAENTSLFFNEHLFAKPSFRPETDFTYVAAIGRAPVALMVTAGFPARTLGEFIAYVKAHPDEVSYSSPGNGTTHHITMELIKQQSGLRMTHIPYRGGALAVQDLVAGRVAATLAEPTVVLQQIKAGQLRPLAVAGRKRVPALPDTPTFAEAGVSGIEGYTVHGLVGPAGMPDEATRRLNAEIAAALKQPKVVAYLSDSGFESLVGTPQSFKELARSESARWGRIIKAAGIKLD